MLYFLSLEFVCIFLLIWTFEGRRSASAGFSLTSLSPSSPPTALLACVLSFNVDQKNSKSFSGGSLEDLFGYTVQQFENSEGKW